MLLTVRYLGRLSTSFSRGLLDNFVGSAAETHQKDFEEVSHSYW
jgi:hypothetical protein